MRALAFVSLVALASCASEQRSPPPQNAVAPVPRPAPPPATPAPPPPPEWIDAPLTPGDWVYRRDDRGSIALFGPPGGDALVTLRCVIDERRVFVSRQAERPVTGTPSLTLRATSSLKTYAAGLTPAPSYVAAEIAPRDSQLDAIALSRGRFLLTATAQTDVIMPAWAEVTRVIEDCR